MADDAAGCSPEVADASHCKAPGDATKFHEVCIKWKMKKKKKIQIKKGRKREHNKSYDKKNNTYYCVMESRKKKKSILSFAI